MKNRKMRSLMSAAVLLLALLSPCAAAHGQPDGPFSNANGKSDGFFSNAGGVRDGNGDVPLGGGLLVLALSGVCYAGAKRKKGKRLKGER